MYLEDLLSKINDYSNAEKNMILRAYAFANHAHQGVKRKSGEPYIIHPVAVACILAEMDADCDTICAGLLHDTIEDVEGITKETIAENFNPTIAELVDGVTKIRKKGLEDVDTKEANMHKIIDSITKDVRIFIVKLADRLHNMRTMEYQTPEKQISKSKETLELYVPIATLLGEFTFKTELEDLVFKYLYSSDYNDLTEKLAEYEKMKRKTIDQVEMEIAMALNDMDVTNNIVAKRKNLYGVYSKMKKYHDITRLHDLFAVKILVPDDKICYEARDKIVKMYDSVIGKGKDYISKPKKNRYMGLHEGIYAEDRTMIQLQFKTPRMYKINAYGITAYWDFCKEKGITETGEVLQDEVKNMPFYKTLVELGSMGLPLEEYNRIVKSDILTRMINIEGVDGVITELPDNSTPVDYAFLTNPEQAPFIESAIVNGRFVPYNCPLESRDRVELIYSDMAKDKEELDAASRCLQTKMKIRKI